MARAALLLALLPALLLAACSGTSPSSAVAATDSPPVAAPGQPGSQTVEPSSPPREVGASEEITVFTHCGLEGHLDWAGSFWREVTRSPAGAPIGDPEDAGRITLTGPAQARFESSTGTVVALERVPGPILLQPCD